jgi:hypothetical protein
VWRGQAGRALSYQAQSRDNDRVICRYWPRSEDQAVNGPAYNQQARDDTDTVTKYVNTRHYKHPSTIGRSRRLLEGRYCGCIAHVSCPAKLGRNIRLAICSALVSLSQRYGFQLCYFVENMKRIRKIGMPHRQKCYQEHWFGVEKLRGQRDCDGICAFPI